MSKIQSTQTEEFPLGIFEIGMCDLFVIWKL